MLSLFVTLVILLLMTVQDLRSRSITLLLFFILGSLTIFSALSQQSVEKVLVTFVINSLFLLMHIMAIFIYLFVKHKRFVNPFRDHLGIGDLLFWVVISPAFSPLNFVLGFLSSLLFAIVVSLFLRNSRTEDKTVPLAGLQALFYAGFLMINFLYLKMDCYDDSGLLKLII
jgi:hypothetical protein